jgi:glycosyltransferase involved in cell wall biosynthesis
MEPPVPRDSPMRVCHLIHALSAGGAEQVLVDLAHAAPAAGLELAVLSLMRFDEQSVNLPALEQAGVSVASLGLTTRWDPRAFAAAEQVVRRLRPSVLHTHLKHADVVGAVVARRCQVPLVSTLHVIEDQPTALGRMKRSLARVARDRVAARTIAVSQAQRDWYIEGLGGDATRTVVVRNGVPAPALPDAPTRAAVRAELGVPSGACLAVTAAVMRPGKGLEDLLEAMARVPRGTDLVLALAGDGPERARLQAQAHERPQVAARIRFLGWRDDVPRLLACADLAVHPSHADALPTALVQAMAAGIPAVATRVGGTPEVVPAGAGILVEPGQPAALAAALVQLAADPAQRGSMGRSARSWYEQQFRVDTWARRLTLLYAEVLAEERVPDGVER